VFHGFTLLKVLNDKSLSSWLLKLGARVENQLKTKPFGIQHRRFISDFRAVIQIPVKGKCAIKTALHI
jgi:hypothetical protein